MKFTTFHPASHSLPADNSTLPFTGRVFLYVDQILSDEDKEGLVKAAGQVGIHLEIRDKAYSDSLALSERPWAFISHDSRDKEALVRPLAHKLSSMMCPVWYDEFSLQVGQSLRESIDKGLREASKCIIVLSPSFLSNPGWTKAEFNAAMSKHVKAGGSVILPIWHNVSRAEVESYSLLITDPIALNSDLGVDELARRLFIAMKPSHPEPAKD